MSFFSFVLDMYFATLLGVSGFAKIAAPKHFAYTLKKQRLLPAWGIPLVSTLFPWLEVGLGLLLISGLFPLYNAVSLGVLFGLFLVIKIILLTTRRAKECGCYGRSKQETINGTSIVISTLLLLFAGVHLRLALSPATFAVGWRVGATILFLLGGCFLGSRAFSVRRNTLLQEASDNEAIGGIQSGQVAPIFTTNDQYGNTVDLTMFRGKWSLLLFVLPGCPACPGALQALSHILKEQPELAAAVVGSDDTETNQRYADQQGIDVPMITSTPQMVEAQYQVTAFPTLFVLNPEGVIRSKGIASTYELVQNALIRAQY